jgi:hypothetical protein
MNTTTRASIIGLTGIALTIPLVYLLDPDNGRQRRATFGSQCKRTAGQLKERTNTVREQLSSRYQSTSAQARSWLDARKRTDEALTRSVRMELWRAFPQSTSIGVVAHGGKVILHGEVLAREHERVLQVVRATPGVVIVADHLAQVSDFAPVRIGPRLRQGFLIARDNLSEPHWSAPTRVWSGTVGLALLRWGSQRRSAYGGLAALAGVGLLVRSVFNTPLRRLGARGRMGVSEPREAAEAAAERAARVADDLGPSAGRRERAASSIRMPPGGDTQ